MGRTLLLFALAVPAAVALWPAHARADGPVADLRLVYQNPELSVDGTGVTWHWTLSNNGAAGADMVVAIQRVSGGQRIVAVSAPCTERPAEVECRFGSIKPGEQRTGWIRTAAPRDGGTLRVDGRVTWQEQGFGRDVPPVDAGATPATPETPPAVVGDGAGVATVTPSSAR
jgi:hypothetical protein